MRIKKEKTGSTCAVKFYVHRIAKFSFLLFILSVDPFVPEGWVVQTGWTSPFKIRGVSFVPFHYDVAQFRIEENSEPEIKIENLVRLKSLPRAFLNSEKPPSISLVEIRPEVSKTLTWTSRGVSAEFRVRAFQLDHAEQRNILFQSVSAMVPSRWNEMEEDLESSIQGEYFWIATLVSFPRV